MKKSIQFLTLISLLGISFTFNSCSKDDHNHDDLKVISIFRRILFLVRICSPFALNQKLVQPENMATHSRFQRIFILPQQYTTAKRRWKLVVSN
jgi:hypothetical protein